MYNRVPTTQGKPGKISQIKFGKLRENLENSGNFETFCLNSGKTQGIL